MPSTVTFNHFLASVRFYIPSSMMTSFKKGHSKRSARRIGFRESIDTEKVSTNMAEGILEIKLPKLEPKPEKKPKKISPQ